MWKKDIGDTAVSLELYAIWVTIKIIIINKIILSLIFTNTLSAIHSISEWFNNSKQSYIAYEIQKCYLQAKKRLVWFTSDCGIFGNERAHFLERLGAGRNATAWVETPQGDALNIVREDFREVTEEACVRRDFESSNTFASVKKYFQMINGENKRLL